MIPRHRPTYDIRDLLRALLLARKSPERVLVEELQRRVGSISPVVLYRRGREALAAALTAQGRQGEVVIPAFGCVAVHEAVIAAGCQPVMADIDPSSLTSTWEMVDRVISSRTTAVVMTHQLGRPCPPDGFVEGCRQRDIMLIEDAAAALGAEDRNGMIGRYGDVALCSFGRWKVVGAEGLGALLVHDPALFDRLPKAQTPPRLVGSVSAAIQAVLWRLSTSRWVFHPPTWILEGREAADRPDRHPVSVESPCQTLSVALAAVQLAELPANLDRRKHISAALAAAVAVSGEISGPALAVTERPSWVTFPVSVTNRRHFTRHMRTAGIDLARPFGRGDWFRVSGAECPAAAHAYEHIVGVPCYPRLSEGELARLTHALETYVPPRYGER